MEEFEQILKDKLKLENLLIENVKLLNKYEGEEESDSDLVKTQKRSIIQNEMDLMDQRRQVDRIQKTLEDKIKEKSEVEKQKHEMEKLVAEKDAEAW